MEDDVFLRPAVAGLMQKHFVEARLHTDIQSSLSAAAFARNRELQKQRASSRAMPIFVVVDPKTGVELGETPPEAFNLEGGWVTFLERMVAAAGR